MIDSFINFEENIVDTNHQSLDFNVCIINLINNNWEKYIIIINKESINKIIMISVNII